MFEGFRSFTLDRQGVKLHGRTALNASHAAPALLLLHGHPQTHSMWHRVAPQLAGHFNVVLMDLRGYGDSDRPPSHAQHTP
jgi:haloacetate dehalogenase